MQIDAVRNPDGIYINTQCFREEGLHFMKHKYYTPDPWGSPGWRDYWKVQLDRCTNGYSTGGVRITGHHYFYLNFAQIQISEEISEKVAKKKKKMPDFWDGDYNYYWSLEVARYGILTVNETTKEERSIIQTLSTLEQAQRLKAELSKLQLSITIEPDYLTGGFHVIVGKARRKGYSYKNGAICANTYNTQPDSLTLIGAFDKKYLYPKGTMGMASDYLNFLNKHTGWRKSREFVDKQDHRRASFKDTIDGVSNEDGYMSEIMALTFKDNPDAARGKDAQYVLLEEAGVFPNLEDAYMATAPGLSAGKYITGQIIIFGTGGDMESGTVDFANMFYNPFEYGLLPVKNIWDDNAEETNCGFFHPMYWNREGYYDEQGNSDTVSAIADEKEHRAKMLKNSSNGSVVLQKRVQEHPFSPSEAFLTVSTNSFPVVELRNRLNLINRENLNVIKGQPVKLFKDETGKVRAKPYMKDDEHPPVIWNFKPKTKDLTGCPVIYEYPIEGAPKGLYKIGYDPYRQDKGTSLASIIVKKGVHRYSSSNDVIVAEYTGRPEDADIVNRIFELFIELYNTEGMHENEVTHVRSYFMRRKKLHLLAAQPDRVISKNVKESKVARVYGCHMNDQMKDAGEKYIKGWLLRERDTDENGNVLTTIDYINSPGLLEELIVYNRKGNFDRVMALMQVMFQEEEEDLEKEYGNSEKSNNAQDAVELISKLFRKN